MTKELTEFVTKIRSEKRFKSLDEAAIKQGIVLKLLSILGWDPFDVDEVCPEYESGNDTVDFSLRHKDANTIFLRVERLSKNFPKEEKKLLELSRNENVGLAVLTSGLTWWFSLPLEGDDPEEIRFSTIDFGEESPRDVALTLSDYLSRESAVSGEVLAKAREIVAANRKDRLIRESLPKAWDALLGEPEKWLVGVLTDVTKELSGTAPDREIVLEFLRSKIGTKEELEGQLSPKAPPPPSRPVKTSGPGGDFTGQNIVGFRLAGTRYEVKTWKDLLLKVCEIVAASQKDGFEYVTKLTGGDKKFFSRSEYELLTPEQIPGTDMYVEVNLGATGIVGLCSKVILLFGYKNSDLIIETRQT